MYWSNTSGDLCGEMFDIMHCYSAEPGVKDLPDNAAVLLLDDAEHGINSAVKNAQLRAIFRTIIKQGQPLKVIVEQMNSPFAHFDCQLLR